MFIYYKIYSLLLICSFSLQQITAQTYNLDSTTLSSRTVVDSIDIPWEILWGPDNHIWMTERFGRVSRVDPQTGQQELLLDISNQVYEQSEAGLLGLLLHPDFDNQPYVYLVHTYLSGNNILEKLVRYNYNGTALISPQILLDNIEGYTTHIGSRLILLQDSTILMSTGDAQDLGLPQNTASLSGKILRLNLDGSIPSDNPISGSYIWSWGHRNAQGLCLSPNGQIYSSEHGPTTDDELNLLVPTQNYGWPNVEGYCDSPPETTFCSDSNVVEPMAAWTPTIAPSDIIWYDHPAIPEFQNKLLMTVLKDKKLIVFGFNTAGDSVLTEEHHFTNNFGRLRDICISPDGKIYLATNGSSWSNNNPFTHSIVELSNLNYSPSTLVQYSNSIDLKLWPNPISQGQNLAIRLSENQVNARFYIFDLQGRLLHQQLIDQQTSIPMNLDAGLYIWQVIREDGEHKSGRIQVKQ